VSYEPPAHVDIHRLIQMMVDQGASDLHLTVGTPPQYRVNGHLVPLRTAPLTGNDVEFLAYSVLSEEQQQKFESQSELDLSFRFDKSTRLRGNFFVQKGHIAGVLRQIPSTTRPLAELGFPKAVEELSTRPNGLVLVTGPTGSGKSTTLASLVDLVNSTRHEHIITIEDPIEFVHNHKRCVVNQREIGSDTANFRDALRYVLRQDPDIVLVGEIRDFETMETVLRVAETGHLVFATLHTNSAVQTIHRVIDFFPAHQQSMVRTQLSFVLEAVVSQTLIPRTDGTGRVMACEVMLVNHAIRNLIREDKMHQVISQMQIGQGKHGMLTLNQSLLSHVVSGAITQEVALDRSYEPEELETMLMKALDLTGTSSRKKNSRD
jgi:twitching motility protein PilT